MLMRRQAGMFRQLLLVFDVLVSMGAYYGTGTLRAWIAKYLAYHQSVTPEWMQFVELPQLKLFRGYELLFYSMPPIWGLALYLAGATDFRVTYRQSFFRYVRAVGMGLALFV